VALQGSLRGRAATRRRRGWESRWSGLLFVAPFAVGLFALFVVPVLAVPVISLTEWALRDTPRFVGLANYARLPTDPDVVRATGVTALFVALLVPANIALSLALALLLNVKARGVGLFRTVLFAPVVVPVVAWALVWRFVLQPDFGLVNRALSALHVSGPNWLFEYPWAVVAVVASMVVEHAGLNMLIFLGALQGVPRELTEAAAIDGATARQTFWNITLPLISPTVFLVVVVTVIGALKAFAPILVLTGGGDAAGVLMVQMWKQGFKYFEFGYASSLAWLLFLAMLALTVVQWQLRKRWVFHET
jgi:multiple sugar transport system permease protein